MGGGALLTLFISHGPVPPFLPCAAGHLERQSSVCLLDLLVAAGAAQSQSFLDFAYLAENFEDQSHDTVSRGTSYIGICQRHDELDHQYRTAPVPSAESMRRSIQTAWLAVPFAFRDALGSVSAHGVSA